MHLILFLWTLIKMTSPKLPLSRFKFCVNIFKGSKVKSITRLGHPIANSPSMSNTWNERKYRNLGTNCQSFGFLVQSIYAFMDLEKELVTQCKPVCRKPLACHKDKRKIQNENWNYFILLIYLPNSTSYDQHWSILTMPGIGAYSADKYGSNVLKGWMSAGEGGGGGS